MGWRISHWQEYEIAADKRCTNKLKAGLDFIKVPVDLRNENLEILLLGKGGAEAFAIWILILQLWGEQPGKKRNDGVVLYQDSPITAEVMARRLPGKWTTVKVQTAIANLLQIGWLEHLQEDSMNLHRKSIENPTIDRERDIDIERDKEKEKTRVRDFVSLTNAELEKLHAELGQDVTDRVLDKLDNYKGSKGKTYKDDYRAMRSWVIKQVLKDIQDEQSSGKVQAPPGKYAGVGKTHS